MPRTKAFDRQETLQKAIELFWEQGYESTSMQDLVDRLGLSRSSIYETFTDKEHLYKEALQTYRDEGYQRIVTTWQKEQSFQNNIRSLFYRIAEEAEPDKCAKGCFLINAAIETAPSKSAIQKQIYHNQDRIISFFKKEIINAKVTGDLSQNVNANEVSALIYNTYAGLQVMSRSNSDSKTIKNVINGLLTILN